MSIAALMWWLRGAWYGWIFSREQYQSLADLESERIRVGGGVMGDL